MLSFIKARMVLVLLAKPVRFQLVKVGDGLLPLVKLVRLRWVIAGVGLVALPIIARVGTFSVPLANIPGSTEVAVAFAAGNIVVATSPKSRKGRKLNFTFIFGLGSTTTNRQACRTGRDESYKFTLKLTQSEARGSRPE
eukprot:g21903.t1